MKRVRILLYGTVIICGIISCRDNDKLTDNDVLSAYLNLPEQPYSYSSIGIPGQLDDLFIEQQNNTPNDNVITDWGATLGRVLFYDKLLSQNRSTSCASCHQQSFAFSDTARFSKGFMNGNTKRHSMSVVNAAYRVSGIFFWDGRANTLEEQVLQPIQDPLEMGLTLDTLVNRVGQQAYYSVLFRKAFGDETVTTERIAKALAQFIRSIQSFDSRFDKGRLTHSINDDFTNFTAEENLGKALFFDLKKGNCGGCHYTEAFVMDVPRNNGLDIWESTADKDIGYEQTTGDPLDRGKFIAPSLRNIAVRPPYMHDGRLSTLAAVIDHYSEGIQWSNTLDDHLKTGNPNEAIRFNLSGQEKNALIAFLRTLTDETLLSDVRYSDPF